MEKIVKEDGKSLAKSSDEKKTMAGYRKGDVLEHTAALCHPVQIIDFSSGRAKSVLCAVMSVRSQMMRHLSHSL